MLDTFLEVVHKHTPSTSLIGISTLTEGVMRTRWYQQRYIADIIESVRSNPKRNLYARITAVKTQPAKGRGSETDSEGCSVLWIDYDCYGKQLEGLARLQALDVPPTLIINSGRGLQAYWLLDRYYSSADELHTVKGANKALLTALDSPDGDSCFDLARVLRIPESYNLKDAANPLEVQVAAYHPERVYTLAQFPTAAIGRIPQAYLWDQAILPESFLDTVRETDKRLYARILSEETARKADVPLTSAGAIDRSRNDYYICERLYKLGYSPDIALAVLSNTSWLAGAKYRDTQRYDYVVSTVHATWVEYQASPDRFFVKTSFRAEKLGRVITSSAGAHRYLYTGETLYRYVNGVYAPDGEAYVRNLVAAMLGPKWSTYAANETVQWLIDTSRKQDQDINKHPNLANVLNGMLDLVSGELLPHNPDYYSIVQVPIEYNPEASTQGIDSFISAVLPADTIPVFWEYVGSSLLIDRYWPKAYLALIGPGDSGKSKVLEWLLNFFGGRARCATVSFQQLADNRFTVAELYGKAANIFSDVSDVEAQSAGQIKTLTGDDYLRAEHKFKAGFTYKNTARLFFSANQHLSVRGPDEAFFNRSLIIRCTNRFTATPRDDRPHEQLADPEIMQKLITPEVMQGGLLRAVQGLQRLMLAGTFTYSQTIEHAQNEFRFSADTVSGFLSAAQYLPGHVEPKAVMYAKYKLACELATRRPVSEDKFFRRVNEIAERFGIDERAITLNKVRQVCYINRKPTIGFLPKEVLSEIQKHK